MKPQAKLPPGLIVLDPMPADKPSSMLVHSQAAGVERQGQDLKLKIAQDLDTLLFNRAQGGATDSASSCQGLMPAGLRPPRQGQIIDHVALLNPQGNFDSQYSHMGGHPDFGGQLIYVLEIAKALVKRGLKVDVITRRIEPTYKAFVQLKSQSDKVNVGIDIGQDPDVLHTSEWEQRVSHVPVQGPQGELLGSVHILRFDSDPQRRTFVPKEQLWDGHLEGMTQQITAYYQAQGKKPQGTLAHYADGGLLGHMLEQSLGVPLLTFTGHSLGAQKQDKLRQSYAVPGQSTFNSADQERLKAFHFPQRLNAERLAMSMARAIVVSTAQERDEQYTHSEYLPSLDPKGADRGKFHIITPGVNTRVFGEHARHPNDGITLARLLNAIKATVPAERQMLPYAIFAARLDEKKNLQGLARAFALDRGALAQHCNLLLLIKGGPQVFTPNGLAALSPDERSLMQQVKTILTGDSDSSQNGNWLQRGAVVVPGLANTQHELNAIFRYFARKNQGFFVYPALYEPFGLMPLEAGLAGLAVAATNQGGPKESLANCGVLVDPSSPQHMQQELLKLATGKDLRRELGQKLQQRVLTTYLWDNTAEKYAELCQQVIDQGGAPSQSVYDASHRSFD